MTQFRSDVFTQRSNESRRQAEIRGGEALGQGIAGAGAAVGAGLVEAGRQQFQRDVFQQQFAASEEARAFNRKMMEAEIGLRESEATSRMAINKAREELLKKQLGLLALKDAEEMTKQQARAARLQGDLIEVNIGAKKRELEMIEEERKQGMSSNMADAVLGLLARQEPEVLGRIPTGGIKFPAGPRSEMVQSLIDAVVKGAGGAYGGGAGAVAGAAPTLTVQGFAGPVPAPSLAPSLLQYEDVTMEQALKEIPVTKEELPDISGGTPQDIRRFAQVALGGMRGEGKVGAVNALRRRGLGKEHLVDAASAYIFAFIQNARTAGIKQPLNNLASEAVAALQHDWENTLDWYVNKTFGQTPGKLPGSITPRAQATEGMFR